MKFLLVISWAVAIVYATIPCYWFLVHPFADFWRLRRRSPFRALLPLWMLILLAVGAITWPWHSAQIYSAPLAWIPALFLFASGISIYRRIKSDFGISNFSGQAEMRVHEVEQKLITTGLHARLRHPIYLAHLCMLLAWTIGCGLLVNYWLLVFAVLTGALMIWLEERELGRRFGDAYRDYKHRVSAIIP